MLFEVYFKNGSMASFESKHWIFTSFNSEQVYLFYSDQNLLDSNGSVLDESDPTKFDAIIRQIEVIGVVRKLNSLTNQD